MPELNAAAGRVTLERLVVYVAPVLAYAGLLFFLSSRSQLPTIAISHVDKVEHFTAYGIFCALTLRALYGYGWRGAVAVVAAVAITSLFGASDEFHQSFVPGRDTDVFDWVADTLGATAGALVWLGARKFFKLRIGKEAP